jgi:hypothetical protein
MDMQNLRVARVLLHEVLRRTNDRQRVDPIYGTQLEQLDAAGLDALRDRVVVAMSRNERCVQMDLIPNAPMVPIIEALADADEQMFVHESRNVADALADAQTRRDIPGGVVVAFTGTIGVPARRFVGIIKAEVHTGFLREAREGRLALRFLDKLLLTPQTKLYKIGMYIEVDPRAVEPGRKWQAFLYDDAMSPRDRNAAAQYFYESFLGLAFPDSSARRTKAFHDLTKQFIGDLGVPEEEKVTLHNALVTYLRADQSPTVNVATFADSYFGTAEIQDAYGEFMQTRGFPQNAVPKDLSDLQSALRLRKLLFPRNVRLTAPPDAFEDLVRVRSIEGDARPDGTRPKWTLVTIKDKLTGQE